MAENIIYDCRWSGDCDEKFIDDFNHVQDQVFRGKHTRGSFKHQYIDNIYGPSVLVVVYMDDKPVAARGLWRNDVCDKEAYQPGRTGVLAECRGKGIFTTMTLQAISLLPKDAIIYNFPNQNSFPGYIKMGWVNINKYYLRLFLSSKAFSQEHPIKMDENYFNWWVKGRSEFRYVRKGGTYYLVRKYPKPFCYKVVAQVEKDIALNCKKGPLFAVYLYPSHETVFYNRHSLPLRPVVKNSDIRYIPLWKIDAI